MRSLEEAFPNRVAGVIRTQNPELAFRACRAAVEGGIQALEVTMTVPGCMSLVQGLVAVADARAVGASFVVTPVVPPEVAEACRQQGVLCVLGALTPTEVYQARLAGAQLVKLLPSEALAAGKLVEVTARARAAVAQAAPPCA